MELSLHVVLTGFAQTLFLVSGDQETSWVMTKSLLRTSQLKKKSSLLFSKSIKIKKPFITKVFSRYTVYFLLSNIPVREKNTRTCSCNILSR